MKTPLALLGIAGSLAVALWLGACSAGGPSGGTGTAGAGSGNAGTEAGTAGTGSGTAGTGSSSAGTGAGTAGTGSGTAGTGSSTAGTSGNAGSGAGTAGASGSGGSGATAGATGTAGTGVVTTGMSAGCTMPPPNGDSPSKWTIHDVDVTGVDPAFISAYPPNNGSTYSWTHRNYFVKLPMGYDPTKSYPVVIGGSGCGGDETVGKEGGYSVLGVGGTQTQAIQVSQSYVASSAVNQCVGFADDFTNSPEPQYIHAMIQDVEAHYCVDKSKIFLNGYSSGAWQATLSGCTNSDEIRAYGVQIGGGLRLKRPPCKPNKTAAIYVVGLQDTSNPIGPLATPNDDSYGSAPSRDDILMRNGCVGTATAQWDPTYPLCVKYTGCPAAYPVVWCPINSGHNPDPNDTTVNTYRYNALWKFYMTLPAAQ